jgi:hypothetical protein
MEEGNIALIAVAEKGGIVARRSRVQLNPCGVEAANCWVALRCPNG